MLIKVVRSIDTKTDPQKMNKSNPKVKLFTLHLTM